MIRWSKNAERVQKDGEIYVWGTPEADEVLAERKKKVA
jgi:hypothetical protein